MALNPSSSKLSSSGAKLNLHPSNIQEIFVEPKAMDSWLFKQCRQYLPDIDINVVENRQTFLAEMIQKEENKTVPVTKPGQDKNRLYFGRQKGDKIRKCPQSPGMLCCNYYTLDVMENCPINCSYCILQVYLNFPAIFVRTDLDNLNEQIESLLKNRQGIIRIGTGELCDSLALDHLVPLAPFLVKLFSPYERISFELKTKSNNIQNLMRLTPGPGIVLGWSMNTPLIQKSFEPGSASVESRLSAIKQAVKNGYKIALHFDPIFYYPNWKKEYQKLIESLADHLERNSITWISMGGFRFTGPIEEMLIKNMGSRENLTRTNFPYIFYGEFCRGSDGKYRYFRDIRLQLYSWLLTCLKKYNLDKNVYLCMENQWMWKKLFNQLPGCSLLPEIFSS